MGRYLKREEKRRKKKEKRKKKKDKKKKTNIIYSFVLTDLFSIRKWHAFSSFHLKQDEKQALRLSPVQYHNFGEMTSCK